MDRGWVGAGGSPGTSGIKCIVVDFAKFPAPHLAYPASHILDILLRYSLYPRVFQQFFGAYLGTIVSKANI